MNPIDFLVAAIQSGMNDDTVPDIREYIERQLDEFFSRYSRFPTEREIIVAHLMVERLVIDAHIKHMEKPI